MNKAMLFLSMALVVVPDLALAQMQQDRAGPGANRPSRPDIRPSPPQRPNPGGPQIQPPRPGMGGPQIQPPRPNPGGPQIQPPRPGTGGPQIQPPRPGRPTPVKPGRPHRPGTGRPPQFRPIHGPGFRYPHGYRYRRWTIGLLLPAIFLSSRYYYDNYAYLGVGSPPYGYRWVRYGPDLLLVNIRTRKVADVIYGAFY